MRLRSRKPYVFPGLAATWVLHTGDSHDHKDEAASYSSDLFSLTGPLACWWGRRRPRVRMPLGVSQAMTRSGYDLLTSTWTRSTNSAQMVCQNLFEYAYNRSAECSNFLHLAKVEPLHITKTRETVTPLEHTSLPDTHTQPIKHAIRRQR